MPECPSQDDLKDYALGKLDHDRLDVLEQHIDTCDLCQTTLETLNLDNDELIRAMRLGRNEETVLEDEAWREAEQLVKAIGRDWSQSGNFPPETVPAPLKQLRDYDLLEELGRGGMGTVYKAVHTKLKKVVALKVLPADRMENEESVRRFEREMQAVGQLHHPHIVQATDAGEVDDTHFLVMEYVEGLNLSELVDKGGPLPVAEACELIRQAALGIQHAHEHGMVHRDIKPSNLMLTEAGQVKILDLGLALLSEGPAGGELTTTNQIMGTLDYMAPEQAADTHAVDIRADLYSLGATLYKLLTGKAPFHSEGSGSPARKLNALLNKTPESLREQRLDVPEPLADLVHRLLAKDPEQRPATPADLIDEISLFAEGADVSHLLTRSQDGTLLTKRIPLATASSVNVSSHLIDTEIVTSPESADGSQSPQAAVSPAQPPAPPRRKIGLGMWGLFAAVLLLGVWLIVRDKDGNEKQRIKLVDGDTLEIVESDPSNFTKPTSQRELFEFVLKKGGRIEGLSGEELSVIRKPSDIPNTSLTNLRVVFDTRKSASITSEELQSLIPYKNQIINLNLNGPEITNAHVEMIAELSQLEDLHLSFSEVDNAAIRFLQKLDNLTKLTIVDNKIDSEGYQALNQFPALRWLRIGSDQVTEAAIDSLNQLPKINHLGIYAPRDEKLTLLSKLKHINHVILEYADENLTEASVRALFELRPDLIISSPFGTFNAEAGQVPPNYAIERQVAEWALDLGGSVAIVSDNSSEAVRSRDDLPDTPFTIQGLDFNRKHTNLDKLNKTAITNWTRLSDLQHLGTLKLHGAQISGEVARSFANISSLREITISGALAGDNAIVDYRKLANLRKLDISGSLVTEEGVLHLVECPALEVLTIDPSQLTTGSIQTLNRFPQLVDLRLVNAADRDIEALSRLTKLIFLHLEGSPNLTKEAITKLSQSMPNTVIYSTFGTYHDASETNYALSFDGVDDYVVIPTLKDPGGETPVTLELWTNAFATESKGGSLISNGTMHLAIHRLEDSPGTYWQVHNQLTNAMGERKGSPAEFLKSPIGHWAGRKVHFAVVYDGTSLRLYRNGTLVGEISGDPFPTIDANNNYLIGKTRNLSSLYSGWIDEVHISNVARYTEDFKPARRFEPDEHTLALYHFDEGDGDILRDASGNGHDGKIIGATWVNPDEIEQQLQQLYDRDRNIAQQLLNNNVSLGIAFSGETSIQIVSPGSPLPDDPFTIKMADISRVAFLDEVLPILAHATEVEDLRAMATGITPEQMRMIAPLTKLEVLVLSKNGTITNELMDVVAEEFMKLHTLLLNESSLPVDGITALPTMAKLNRLTLVNSENVNESITLFAEREEVEGLNVMGSDVTWPTLKSFLDRRKNINKHNFSLNFDCSLMFSYYGASFEARINDQAKVIKPADPPAEVGPVTVVGVDLRTAKNVLELLHYMETWVNVDWINLSGTEIKDSTMEVLKSFPRIQKLNVSSTPLSDKALLQLTSFPAITSVELRGTKASPSAIAHLKQRKPGCEFLTDFSDEELQNAPPLFAFDPSVPETSLFDQWNRAEIDPYELMVAGDGDAENLPEELVAIYGDSRLHHAYEGGERTILFSDDAKSVVTVAPNGRIILWDVESGNARKIVNTGNQILSLNSLGDSGQILVSSNVSDSAIYDLSTLELISTLTYHGPFQSVSADGTIGVGTDMGLGICRVWKVNPPKELYKVNAHPDNSIAATMQPQGEMFATAGGDGVVKIWETQSGKELQAFHEHSDPVIRVTFSPDGQTAYSGDKQGKVFCWEATTGKVLWQYLGDPARGGNTISCIEASPDGKVIAIGARYGDLLLLEASSGKSLQFIQSIEHAWHSAAFSRDSRFFATISRHGKIRIWNLETFLELHPEQMPQGKIIKSSLSESGRYLATCDLNGTVTVRDNATGEIIHQWKRDYPATAIAIHERNDLVAVGTRSTYHVELYSLSTGEYLCNSGALNNWPTDIKFTKDGSRLLVANTQKQVYFLDPFSLEIQAFLQGVSSGSGNLIAASQDGKTIVTVGSRSVERSYFSILDPDSGEVIFQSPQLAPVSIQDIAVSRNGKMLVVSLRQEENAIQLWDLEKKVLISKFGTRMGGGDYLIDQIYNNNLTFSPDGRKLYTAFDEGEVEVWDLDNIDNPDEARSVIKVGGPMDGFYGLHIEPAGKHLITHNGNDTLYVLRLKPEHRGIKLSE